MKQFLLQHLMPHWALVLLTAAVIPWLTRHTDKPGEWYPFSNFPMYSTFEAQTYYVFVSDLKDQPIAASDVLSASSSNIKKAYDRKLIQAKKTSSSKARRHELPQETRRAAGSEVLQWLATSASKQERVQGLGGLRLHQVDITFKDGVVGKHTTLVGEITLPQSTTKPVAP